MSDSAFITAIGLVLAAIVLVAGMRWLSALQYAKVRAAAEAAGSGSTAALASIHQGVEDIRSRLGTIEKILKAVE